MEPASGAEVRQIANGVHVELFHDVQIDWLGKKWYFLGFSLIFSVAGLLSIFFWHGIPLGVDFKGGTLVYVKFDAAPDYDQIRSAIAKAGIRDTRIQRFGPASNNQVIVSLPEQQTQEANLEAGRTTIVKALQDNYSAAGRTSQGKLDLDNVGRATLTDLLTQDNPEHLGPDAAPVKYARQVDAILNYRDRQNGGLIRSYVFLQGVADAGVIAELEQKTYLSGFTVFNVEIVGPQVGQQLRKQALLA
ncbi:MAG: secF, partial [Acidobacteriaceae bacterium]|nr:secF [Acidobacteriaceae bacterium]